MQVFVCYVEIVSWKGIDLLQVKPVYLSVVLFLTILDDHGGNVSWSSYGSFPWYTVLGMLRNLTDTET